MSDERTGVDVLLSVEKQIAQLMHMQSSLDLNIKILSNKLNQVIDLLNEVPSTAQMNPSMSPIALATAPSTPVKMKIEEEFKPPIPITTDTAPVGFRRTSRPETFTNAHQQPTKNTPTPAFPLPKMKSATSIIEPPPSNSKQPLSQRIVDRNGASIFKADIEVMDEAGHTIWKGQTGTTGKWQTALSPGKYRLNVRKQTTQQKIAVSADLVVNDKTPQELPPMSVK
jgi:hypothetical protein